MKKIYIWTYVKQSKSPINSKNNKKHDKEEFEREIEDIDTKDDKQIMNKLLMLLSSDVGEES